MKEWRGIIGLFSKVTMALLLLVTGNACLAQVTDISQAELLQRIMVKHEQLILDVRSPEEYKEGHVTSYIHCSQRLN